MAELTLTMWSECRFITGDKQSPMGSQSNRQGSFMNLTENRALESVMARKEGVECVFQPNFIPHWNFLLWFLLS